MAYTPELSDKTSCTLRRLAWSLNKPMTKTMEWVFTDLVKFIPAAAVCEACRDPRCSQCVFNNEGKSSGELFALSKGKEQFNVEQADRRRAEQAAEVV